MLRSSSPLQALLRAMCISTVDQERAQRSRRFLMELVCGAALLVGGCSGSAPPAAGADAAAHPSADAAKPSGPASGPQPSLPPPFERVILVTIDTLRRDHLQSYGYARETAPFFERLAHDGVLFQNAFAAVSLTAPSHATMLTGVPPRVHGVRKNGTKLPGDRPTLQTMFGAADYATAAFLSVQFLKGIAGGFEHVSADAPEAHELIDGAIDWAHAQRDKPFFLWVHIYEPHKWKAFFATQPATSKIRARQAAIRRLQEPARQAVIASTPKEAGSFYDYLAQLHGLPAVAPGAPFELPWSGLDSRGEEQGPGSREELIEFIDSYDGLIRYADDEVRRLYEALEAPGSHGRGLWILTADHGEGLGSHGYEGHGGRVYNEQLHVPLLFHASDHSLPQRTIDALVQHLDLVPTLAELNGFAWAPPNQEFFGRSLVPLLAGKEDGFAARFTYAEQHSREDSGAQDQLFAIQDRNGKLIRHLDGSEEFFQLRDDPLELAPRSSEEARRVELRSRLDASLELYSRFASGEAQEVAPELADELQALGYAR